MDIFTAVGTAIGARPIRDIVLSLPHVTEDFAADPLSPGLLSRHYALWCRHDRNAKSTVHPGNLGPLNVHSQARLRHSLQAAKNGLLLSYEAQEHLECTVIAVANNL